MMLHKRQQRQSDRRCQEYLAEPRWYSRCCLTS